MFTAHVRTLGSDSELDRTIIEDSGYEARGLRLSADSADRQSGSRT